MKFKPIKFESAGTLAEFLGGKVPEYDYSETYDWERAEALKEGLSEDEAEERARERESQEESDAFLKFEGALFRVAEKVFSEHDMTFERKEIGYIVYPRTSWKESADKIRETINGVGYFYFGTLREFLRSGPFAPRECVVGHLGWITSYYEVYEACKTWSMVERSAR